MSAAAKLRPRKHVAGPDVWCLSAAPPQIMCVWPDCVCDYGGQDGYRIHVAGEQLPDEVVARADPLRVEAISRASQSNQKSRSGPVRWMLEGATSMTAVLVLVAAVTGWAVGHAGLAAGPRSTWRLPDGRVAVYRDGCIMVPGVPGAGGAGAGGDTTACGGAPGRAWRDPP